MSEIKQVIVVRTTYPHPTKEGEFFKPRSGKLIAQACHAAMAFLTRQLQGQQIQFRHERATGDLQARFAADIDIDARLVPYWEVFLTDVVKRWIDSNFAKVCLQVNSEQELLDIEAKAKEASVECHVVTDNGLTEFNGVPTKTALALGPDYSEKIDKITGHLKLY